MLLLQGKAYCSSVPGQACHKVDNKLVRKKKIVAQHRKHEDCTAPVLHRRSLV